MTAYLQFRDQNVRDASNDCDKIECVPPITKVTLNEVGTGDHAKSIVHLFLWLDRLS